MHCVDGTARRVVPRRHHLALALGDARHRRHRLIGPIDERLEHEDQQLADTLDRRVVEDRTS